MTSIDKNAAPLCVDLDGTLIKTDLLIESFFQLIKSNFLHVFLVPFWLAGGKANLKHRIAERVEIDAVSLPYNMEFLDYLRERKKAGISLVLVTASHEVFAHRIARHLSIFDEVIATSANNNLSGTAKRDYLVQRYGDHNFDYAGNAKADLQVWQHARNAILVTPERGVSKAAQNCARVDRVFDNRQSGPGEYIRAMRPHQWLKNILIFIPLLVSHKWHDTGLK